MGLPHSTTLSRRIARHFIREVVECGCPLPLYLHSSTRATVLFYFETESEPCSFLAIA